MKALTILEDEKFLRQKSSIVDLDDKDLKKDIEVIEEYCLNHDVLAMASVQLGIPKRIVYLKNTNLDMVKKIEEDEELKNSYNEAKILINPVVIKKEGLTKYWEACASCLDNVGLVKRPYKIYLEYVDINGKKYSEIFEGFESTVLSHELDHLDGILHMDIADKLLYMEREERKKLREKEDYLIISKTGDFDKLKTQLK